jgi:hypothetical protein
VNADKLVCCGHSTINRILFAQLVDFRTESSNEGRVEKTGSPAMLV